MGWRDMDWTDLIQDRDQCRALVNMVMNLRIHKMLESSWVAAQLADSEEGLSSMQFTYGLIILTIYFYSLKTGPLNTNSGH
jgi:hypothetical protein